MAEATCQTQTVNINFFPPCVSQDLELFLETMDEEPKTWQLNEFFEAFGTHAVEKLTYGVKFLAKAFFEKTKAAQELEKGRMVTFSP